MLKIGEFSKLSRVSVRMLRHYDEIGLLKPAEIDRFTDYRDYREDQLPTMCRITALKDMGFSRCRYREDPPRSTTTARRWRAIFPPGSASWKNSRLTRRANWRFWTQPENG